MCNKYNIVYECGDEVEVIERCRHRHVDIISWNDRRNEGNCPACKLKERQEKMQEMEAKKQEEKEEKLRLKAEEK
jgi:hypothetical protein